MHQAAGYKLSGDPDVEIRIRDVRPDEMELIYNSWIKGMVAKYGLHVDKAWLCPAQHLIIDRLLERADVRVATSTVVDDEVVGYVVFGPGRLLHWVFVKRNWRREHVATRLLEDAFGGFGEPVCTTHKSRSIYHFKKCWNLVPDAGCLGELCRNQY